VRLCDGATVDADTVSACEDGLLVSSSDGARVLRNEVVLCLDDGIRVEAGERYVVARNVVSGALTGIAIDQCHDSTVLENDATSNYVGLELQGCNGCAIRDNLVSKSSVVGLRLSGSDGNELQGNRIRLNMVGIELRSSEGNSFNGTALRANHWRAVEGDVGDNRFTGTVEGLNGWLRFVLLYLPPIVAAAVAPFAVRGYLRRRREGARPPGIAVRTRFPAGRAGLWALSAYVMDETFFISQLEQAGPQRERVIERYESGIASAKALTTMTSFIVAAILVMLTSIPVSGVMGVLDVRVTGKNVNDVLFSASVPLLLYSGMLFMVLLVFTLTFLASLLQGDAFKPLGALPLDRREMRRVTAYVLVRMYGLPLAVVVLAYPVIGGMFTGSWGFFAAALLGNVLNVATVLALVVWACDVLGRRVFRGGSSRGSTALRVAVMVGYTVVAFSIFAIMGLALDAIGGLYMEQRMAGASGELVNAALALVPFALPSSYLTAMTLVPLGTLPLPVVAGAIAGTAAQAAIAYALLRRARRALGAVAMAAEGGGGPGQHASVGDIALRTRSPVAAFAREGLLVASREMGTLMYLIMPIIMPIMMVVPSAVGGPAIDTPSVLMGYIMYAGIGAVLITLALSTADANLGSVLMGLPFRARDLYRAKHATLSAMLLLSLLVLMGVGLPRARDPGQVLTYVVPQLALVPAVASIALLLYSALFGRFARRYTFYLIDPTNKVLKYVAIGAALYGLVLGEVIVTWWAVGPAGADPAVVAGALVASNLALAGMLEWAARRMLG
jgi:parallel beta-helix repeat protein